MNNAVTLKLNALFLCVVNVFFTFAGITLNSVVILSLWNSQLRRKLCYFMIFILACFDLAVVAVIHPFILFQTISGWMSMNFAESGLERYLYILADISLTALLTLTLERYLALMYPFFHQKFVTKQKLMAFFLLYQLPLGVSNLLYKSYMQLRYKAIYLAIFGGLLLMLCILNVKLFHIARTVRKRTAETLRHVDGSNSEPRSTDTKKFKLILASLRKTSTCVLVSVCLFVCHVPWIVRFALLDMNQPGIDDQNTFFIILWTETLFTINSSLNCLIFFYKNSVLRRHGGIFFKKCFCGGQRLA